MLDRYHRRLREITKQAVSPDHDTRRRAIAAAMRVGRELDRLHAILNDARCHFPPDSSPGARPARPRVSRAVVEYHRPLSPERARIVGPLLGHLDGAIASLNAARRRAPGAERDGKIEDAQWRILDAITRLRRYGVHAKVVDDRGAAHDGVQRTATSVIRKGGLNASASTPAFLAPVPTRANEDQLHPLPDADGVVVMPARIVPVFPIDADGVIIVQARVDRRWPIDRARHGQHR